MFIRSIRQSDTVFMRSQRVAVSSFVCSVTLCNVLWRCNNFRLGRDGGSENSISKLLIFEALFQVCFEGF
jgi:hypothetical protein